MPPHSLKELQEKIQSLEKELEEKLNVLKENRQRMIQKSRLESLGELSAGLAHEINQPLSVISLSLQNLEQKVRSGKADQDYLLSKFNSISDNLNKIQQLIDHVRLFSREQKENLFERVDVNETIISALSLINEQLRNHRISVEMDFEEIPGFTIGNASRLEQVFLNLFSNSRDALDEKEKNTAQPGLSKNIKVLTRLKKDKIEVIFWDNGIGISKKDLPRIFDPFFTSKPPGKGTGLGLPIAYGIIHDMHGEIIAKSIVGSQTSITIHLPFHEKH